MRYAELLEEPSDNNVGRSVRLAPGGKATILDLVGSDARSHSVAVALSLRPTALEPLSAAAIARGDDELAAVAEIELGAGGLRFSFDVDVGRGAVVSLHAAALRVTARNTCRAELEVGACASYAHARCGPPRLSVQGPSLAPSQAWLLEVPRFAADVDVLAPVDAALDLEVGVGRRGERWSYGDRVRSGARLVRPLPILNGCAQLRVSNRAPSPVTPLLLFTLAL